MSWTLIAETNTGWKKYRDSHGNSRYIGPNGFTNEKSYNGGLGSATEEIEHEPNSANSQDESKITKKWSDRRPVGGSGTVTPKFEKENVTEKYKYEASLNYNLEVGGVPIENVAWTHYTDRLLDKSKSLSESHETFFWRVYYRIVNPDVEIDGQSIMNTSQVETEDINLLVFNMREIKRKLMDIKDSYTDVLIDSFEICVRDYGESLA